MITPLIAVSHSLYHLYLIFRVIVL